MELDLDEGRIADWEKLKGLVAQEIVCPKTKVALDAKTAVAIEIRWRSGNVGFVVVDVSAWPNLERQLPSLRALSLVDEVKVYDGRKLSR